MDIRHLNTVTGDILRFEQSIEGIKYNLTRLRETNNCFTAKMNLKIGNSRFEYNQQLTKEEVCEVLERKLAEETEILEKCKKVYEEIMNETPA